MIVQTVLIRWMKNTRGEPYASLRTHQPAAFPLPTAIPTNPYPLEKERILVHRLVFHQTVKGIEQIDDTCEWLPMPAADIEIKHAKLPGLFPQRHAEYIAVRFGYDPSFGKPVRTDDRSGLLDELAFVLGKGQYGRIIINGRAQSKRAVCMRFELSTYGIRKMLVACRLLIRGLRLAEIHTL